MARVPLEDVANLVLDHPEVTLTATLLSACAEEGITVITVDEKHLPNGVLTPFLAHHRTPKMIRAQLALGAPATKRLWQRLVQQKITNQAAMLLDAGSTEAGQRLHRMVQEVRSGDPTNVEAQAAQTYFRAIWGSGFRRSAQDLPNAMMNYGYAILRSALARALICHGFLPSLGLHHRSEQNAFNLADDLIEPFRPLVDRHVYETWLGLSRDLTDLTPPLKGRMVGVLHRDCSHGPRAPATPVTSTVLVATEAAVTSLARVCLQDDDPATLDLPRTLIPERAPDEGPEEAP